MRSKLDPTHIAQMTFDEDAEAMKVKLEATEINMELNHADGDSVTAHPAKLVASAIECDEADDNKEVIPALDCSSLRELHLAVEGEGTAEVLVSPVDSGDFFYKLGNAGQILKVCARRVKVVSKTVRGNVHLVGRA